MGPPAKFNQDMLKEVAVELEKVRLLFGAVHLMDIERSGRKEK